MSRLVVLVLFWSASALADPPPGTYTLDRGGYKPATNAEGAPHPSCGGTKLYGGLATFVVDYHDKNQIRVNGRPWRFQTFAGEPSAPDAHVVISDPQSKQQVWIWFRAEGEAATGYLSFAERRNGKLCVDAWEMRGKFEHR